MTVSNVHTFSMTRDEIIIEALELTAMHNLGTTPSPERMESFAKSLNLFFKAWQPKGLFLHTYKPATLFLGKGQQSYLLGPAGDHATESYNETTLTADAASSDTVLTVDSESDMTINDYVGIVLDDGTLHWDTIASLAPLTLTNGIASAATSGNKVYFYTTKIIRPLNITNVRLMTDASSDQTISKMSISDYMDMPTKNTESTPSQYAYDPQLDNARLYLWPTASDVTEKINFLYQKPVDDFTTDTDTATAPANWLQCLCLGLAYTIGPKVQIPLDEQAALKARYEDALRDLDDFEETTITFAPARR